MMIRKINLQNRNVNMKEIELLNGMISIVDDSDFLYLNKFRWLASYSPTTNTYYAYRTYTASLKKRIFVRMHREILGITDPKIQIDHKNKDTLDNRRGNLRIATASQNGANRRKRENCSSQYFGVYWDKGIKRWVARLTLNKEKIFGGCFIIEKDAAMAYDRIAKDAHKEFAHLNFPN